MRAGGEEGTANGKRNDGDQSTRTLIIWKCSADTNPLLRTVPCCYSSSTKFARTMRTLGVCFAGPLCGDEEG